MSRKSIAINAASGPAATTFFAVLAARACAAIKRAEHLEISNGLPGSPFIIGINAGLLFWRAAAIQVLMISSSSGEKVPAWPPASCSTTSGLPAASPGRMAAPLLPPLRISA